VSELTKRVLLALALAPLFIFILWLGGGWFYGLMSAVAALIVWELHSMFSDKGITTNPYFALLFLAGGLAFPILNFPIEYIYASLLIFIVVETLRPPHERVLASFATLFSAFYPVFGILGLLFLRDFSDDTSTGFIVTLILILMIWGNDVFAYFGGKTFGKHKMAPLISPKKTWEGFASGFLGAALVLIVGWFLAADLLSLSLTELLPMILLVSVFGPVGDLFASKIKRFTGSKDSGKLLPGHGGFFDRFDSLLLVSPSVYIYFSILNML